MQGSARREDMSPLLVYLLLPFIILRAHLCNGQKVPALYIFGDSSVDVGNNNHLLTLFKSNRRPYGRDWRNSTALPTGRFSNGKLFVDYLAEYLHLPYPPAYSDPERYTLEAPQGVNFASAGSGILEDTASIYDVAPLSRQVEWYYHYREELIEMLGESKATKNLIDAIYVISMLDNNDYRNQYLLSPALRAQYNEIEFQTLLLQLLRRYLQDLSLAGARKMVVVSSKPVGCDPIWILLYRTNGASGCRDAENNFTQRYNERLKQFTTTYYDKTPQLDELTETQERSYIVYGNLYDALYNLESDTTGSDLMFKVKHSACCGISLPNGLLTCAEHILSRFVCTNADDYIYWDSLHFTQKVHGILANKLWEGTVGEDCTPFCIKSLAKAP